MRRLVSGQGKSSCPWRRCTRTCLCLTKVWDFVLRNESTKFWLYVQAMEFLTLKVGKPRPTSVVRGGITFSASLAQKISTSGENESLIMSTSPDWKSGVWRNRVSNYLTTALQSYLDTIDSLPSQVKEWRSTNYQTVSW